VLHSDMILIRHQVHPMVERAYIDSQKFHDGQVRKYTGAPYWTHTREVAAILIRCGIEDPEMLVAAHLHDVIEDCGVTEDWIADQYSHRVGSLVLDLTEVPVEGKRAWRKQAECLRLRGINPDAMTIKCADLISNTDDIVTHAPGFAKVYLPEKRNILYGFDNADPVVLAWAWRSLEQAEVALAQS
jgi:(p)ppGpp synthase/HD superfamily hydrolase